jgi:hypothetical protein
VCPPSAALAAATRAASDWGAELTAAATPGGAGRLRLPVTVGLRRGWMEGELVAEELSSDTGGTGDSSDIHGSRLSFRVERSGYSVPAGPVAFLILGALGGLTLVVWPLYPPLLRLAPLGVVLALGAWFVVLSRLRVSGPEEFLEMVSAVSAGAAGAAGAADPAS